MTETVPPTGGRPKFKLDKEQVKKLAELQCTMNLLGMSDNGLIDSDDNAPLPWVEDATN